METIPVSNDAMLRPKPSRDREGAVVTARLPDNAPDSMLAATDWRKPIQSVSR
jgi:hypothetical protein